MNRIMVFMLFVCAGTAFGAQDEHTATITRLEGEVRILSPKSGNGKTARVQGKDYDFRQAVEGDKVGMEHVLQSLKGGRARIVFPNGDQMALAQNSLLKLSLVLSKKVAKPVVDLMFGKVRAIIQQGGPRANSEVRTATMTMGVRGTDFFVVGTGAEGKSAVTVLRGEVAVRPTEADEGKEVKVASGFTFTTPALGAKEAKPELVPVAKSELVEIQRQTVLPLKADAPAEVLKLEEKALEAAKVDLMKYDPEAAKTLAGAKDADEINTHEVKKVFEKAGKPGEEQLRLEQDDVYRKYFKEERK